MKKFTDSFIGKLVVNVVIFLVVWPLVDMAWTKLISHEAFQYTAAKHILEPAITAAAVTLVEHFGILKKKTK